VDIRSGVDGCKALRLHILTNSEAVIPE
jgi:hypothetical protein